LASHTLRCVADPVATTAPYHSEQQYPLSGDMIRTVVGVASGVLSLLLIVIVLSFCKPRLQDFKRLWRDKREDEVGKRTAAAACVGKAHAVLT